MGEIFIASTKEALGFSENMMFELNLELAGH